jgi:hypothetical protein
MDCFFPWQRLLPDGSSNEKVILQHKATDDFNQKQLMISIKSN